MKAFIIKVTGHGMENRLNPKEVTYIYPSIQDSMCLGCKLNEAQLFSTEEKAKDEIAVRKSWMRGLEVLFKELKFEVKEIKITSTTFLPVEKDK